MMSPKFRQVLAVESSCDDTSVAVVKSNGEVVSLASISQDAEHEVFGGIVPEIASRNHNQNLLPLIEISLKKADLDWDDIDGICVTSEPGLLGSLIVGVVTVKTLALAKKKVFLGVNHLEGHLMAPFLKDSDYQAKFDLGEPMIALAISGGHTSLYYVKDFAQYELLGTTRDDAAGEAFDKLAKMLGLGYPGGLEVDRRAVNGNRKAFSFPKTLLEKDSLDFSFSGLKSAAQRQIQSMTDKEIDDSLNDLCASYQETIVNVLIEKLRRAIKLRPVKRFIVTGGVIANSRLREALEEFANENKLEWMAPPLRYCTDNAAMIGLAGIKRLEMGEQSSLDLKPSPVNRLLFRGP